MPIADLIMIDPLNTLKSAVSHLTVCRRGKVVRIALTRPECYLAHAFKPRELTHPMWLPYVVGSEPARKHGLGDELHRRPSAGAERRHMCQL
jgi:hypothetical protein